MQVIGRHGAKGEGPYMNIILECENGLVTSAQFETYGCPSAIRCGDWVTKWAKGRPPPSLLVMEPADLLIVVGGLPLGKEFCAEMTVNALRDAVRQCKS